jgi:hypothetical protein
LRDATDAQLIIAAGVILLGVLVATINLPRFIRRACNALRLTQMQTLF